MFLSNKMGLCNMHCPMRHQLIQRLNQAFSLKELLSAVQDTKNTTSGPDNICYEMFKHVSTQSLEVMLQLFNKIWFTGKITPSWLHSIIIPIPKPNKPSHFPSSYRPISLSSNVCKLFEKMVVCRLNWFLKYHNICLADRLPTAPLKNRSYVPCP